MEEQLLVALACPVLLILYGKWMMIKKVYVKISLRMDTTLVLVLYLYQIPGHSLILNQHLSLAHMIANKMKFISHSLKHVDLALQEQYTKSFTMARKPALNLEYLHFFTQHVYLINLIS
jgi:hypothetical protein